MGSPWCSHTDMKKAPVRRRVSAFIGLQYTRKAAAVRQLATSMSLLPCSRTYSRHLASWSFRLQGERNHSILICLVLFNIGNEQSKSLTFELYGDKYILLILLFAEHKLYGGEIDGMESWFSMYQKQVLTGRSPTCYPLDKLKRLILLGLPLSMYGRFSLITACEF